MVSGIHVKNAAIMTEQQRLSETIGRWMEQQDRFARLLGIKLQKVARVTVRSVSKLPVICSMPLALPMVA